MPSHCPNCGKPVQPGNKFCENCGHKLVQEPQTQTQAPTQTPQPTTPMQQQTMRMQQKPQHSPIANAAYVLGILGLIFCIIGLIGVILQFFVWGLGFLGFLSWIGIVLGVLAMILGGVAYWGQWKDRRGFTAFILGIVIIILFAVTIVVGYLITVFMWSQMYNPYNYF